MYHDTNNDPIDQSNTLDPAPDPLHYRRLLPFKSDHLDFKTVPVDCRKSRVLPPVSKVSYWHINKTFAVALSDVISASFSAILKRRVQFSAKTSLFRSRLFLESPISCIIGRLDKTCTTTRHSPIVFPFHLILTVFMSQDFQAKFYSNLKVT